MKLHFLLNFILSKEIISKGKFCLNLFLLKITYLQIPWVVQILLKIHELFKLNVKSNEQIFEAC